MTFLNPAHAKLVAIITFEPGSFRHCDPLRMLSKKRGGAKGLNNSHSMTFLNPVLASWLPLRMRNMKRGGTEHEIQNCINLPWLQILQL